MFKWKEVEIKPSFPFSLQVYGNLLVLKQQAKNFKNLFITKKENNEKSSNIILKNKDYQQKMDHNSRSLDNSNETDSLTIDEIMDTLIETEKNEKKERELIE